MKKKNGNDFRKAQALQDDRMILWEFSDGGGEGWVFLTRGL
jgi:hypothetical protein